eukprot:14245-Heterococcus_DN1.PRE.7
MFQWAIAVVFCTYNYQRHISNLAKHTTLQKTSWKFYTGVRLAHATHSAMCTRRSTFVVLLAVTIIRTLLSIDAQRHTARVYASASLYLCAVAVNSSSVTRPLTAAAVLHGISSCSSSSFCIELEY